MRTVKTTRWDASVTWLCPQDAALSFSRISVESTTMNFHGCKPNEDGVKVSDVFKADHASGVSLRVGSNPLVAYLKCRASNSSDGEIGMMSILVLAKT